MSLESTRTFVDGIELFASLPESLRNDIAALGTFRELPPGEYLFREAEPGTFMFVVERGWLEIGPQDVFPVLPVLPRRLWRRHRLDYCPDHAGHGDSVHSAHVA